MGDVESYSLSIFDSDADRLLTDADDRVSVQAVTYGGATRDSLVIDLTGTITHGVTGTLTLCGLSSLDPVVASPPFT
jgi:hypothetical protein